MNIICQLATAKITKIKFRWKSQNVIAKYNDVRLDTQTRSTTTKRSPNCVGTSLINISLTINLLAKNIFCELFCAI